MIYRRLLKRAQRIRTILWINKDLSFGIEFSRTLSRVSPVFSSVSVNGNRLILRWFVHSFISGLESSTENPDWRPTRTCIRRMKIRIICFSNKNAVILKFSLFDCAIIDGHSARLLSAWDSWISNTSQSIDMRKSSFSVVFRSLWDGEKLLQIFGQKGFCWFYRPFGMRWRTVQASSHWPSIKWIQVTSMTSYR